MDKSASFIYRFARTLHMRLQTCQGYESLLDLQSTFTRKPYTSCCFHLVSAQGCRRLWYFQRICIDRLRHGMRFFCISLTQIIIQDYFSLSKLYSIVHVRGMIQNSVDFCNNFYTIQFILCKKDMTMNQNMATRSTSVQIT